MLPQPLFTHVIYQPPTRLLQRSAVYDVADQRLKRLQSVQNAAAGWRQVLGALNTSRQSGDHGRQFGNATSTKWQC